MVYDTRKKLGNGSSNYARTEIQNAGKRKRIQSELNCTMLAEDPREEGEARGREKRQESVWGMHDGGRLTHERREGERLGMGGERERESEVLQEVNYI